MSRCKNMFGFFVLCLATAPPVVRSLNTTSHNFLRYSQVPCQSARHHPNYPNSCSYALAHDECQSGALIQYIQLYYCISDSSHAAYHLLKQVLCFVALSLWLAALFYMLGNTAADYFCSCLERLSTVLRLPPTVVGVTLLPLGNGAPDVFASVVAFTGGRGGEVGLNAVLGGALFVVTVVAGLVNVLVTLGGREVRIDGKCFVRDGSFFLFSLTCLGAFLWRGRITGWEGVCYLGLYGLYAALVVTWEVVKARFEEKPGDEESGAYNQLPDGERVGNDSDRKGVLDRMITVPVWLWGSHLVMLSNPESESSNQSAEALPRTPTKDPDETENSAANQAPDSPNSDQPNHHQPEEDSPRMKRTKSLLKISRKASKLLIKAPLSLPRELTIPIIDVSRWSRPRAVLSATLAPILLASVWSAENSTPITSDLGLLTAGLAAGGILGLTAFLTTVNEHPPRCQVAWISAGFFMSVVWFYVIARELVAALVSLAAVTGLDAGILGLTVLAWGNSIGDLVANTTMATRRNGGETNTVGVQIAMAGCYGSPMFNLLVGLGVSLMVAGFGGEKGVYVVPEAGMAMVTVGFVGVAVVGAMGVLGLRGMRLSRGLGAGLIGWYGVFLVVRAGMSRWM